MRGCKVRYLNVGRVTLRKEAFTELFFHKVDLPALAYLRVIPGIISTPIMLGCATYFALIAFSIFWLFLVLLTDLSLQLFVFVSYPSSSASSSSLQG